MDFRSDQWTLIDQLGFRPAGDNLARLIVLAEPPFAVGVNGKWGSGKTSLMRYAMARLGGLQVKSYLPARKDPLEELSDRENTTWNELMASGNVNAFIAEARGVKLDDIKPKTETFAVRCVWFNPWQYQQEPMPLVPLLHEIRAQFSAWLKIQKEADKMVRVTVEAGLELLSNLSDAALGLLNVHTKFSGMIGAIRSIGERHERERFEGPTDAQRFSLHFEQAVELLLGNSSGRLVIFIDDLDRCEEGRVLHLLEVIKLFLSTKNCVFVLGIDRAAVERAIERVWDKSSPHEAREYIEKLFQAVVNVPLCQDYRHFIETRLKEAHFPAEKCEPLIEVLDRILERNPRKVKNFLNGLVMAWRLARDEQLDPVQVALLHYLSAYHPDVYRAIEQDGRKLETLFRVLQGEQPKGRPVSALFRSHFLHVLVSQDKEEDLSQAQAAFKARLDQHRGDEAFVEAFGQAFDSALAREPAHVAALCGAARSSSQPEGQPQGAAGPSTETP